MLTISMILIYIYRVSSISDNIQCNVERKMLLTHGDTRRNDFKRVWNKKRKKKEWKLNEQL